MTMFGCNDIAALYLSQLLAQVYFELPVIEDLSPVVALGCDFSCSPALTNVISFGGGGSA